MFKLSGNVNVKIVLIGIILALFSLEFLVADDVRNKCQRMQELLKKTEELRELTSKGSIRCLLLNRSEYQTMLKKRDSSYVSSGLIDYEEFLYKALFFIEQNYPYRECYYESATENVAAFHLGSENAIVLPDWKDVPDDILVHELVHALQEENFGVSKWFQTVADNTDNSLAFVALLEGDATEVQLKYLNEFQIDLRDMAVEESSENNCSDPVLISKLNSFPYTFGRLFVSQLIKAKGLDFLNKLLAQAPALTSKDILHRKIFGSKTYRLREPAKNIKKYFGLGVDSQVLREETLGQYFIRLMFSRYMSEPLSIRAGKGWLYDRVRTSVTGSREKVIQWSTFWESDLDADEFYQAFIRVLNEEYDASLSQESKQLIFQKSNKVYYVSRNSKNVLILIRRRPNHS